MKVIQTGITAKLTQEDIDEAVVEWMAKQGYEINAEEIEYTMGRNPKRLKAEIITGVVAPSRRPGDENPTTSKTETSEEEESDQETETTEEEGNVLDDIVDQVEDAQASAEDASDESEEETTDGGGSLFGND